MSLKLSVKSQEDPISSDLDSVRGGHADMANSAAAKGAKKATTEIRKMDLEPQALATFRKQRGIAGNTVVTSKYTWYTFLPVNLFMQFTKKVANLYFLLIMFMQMIKVISISNG